MNRGQVRRSKGLCVKCGAEALRNLVAVDRAHRDVRIWQARGRVWFTYEAATHDRFCGDCYELQDQAADKRERDRLKKIDRYHKNQDRYWAVRKAGLCTRCEKSEPAEGHTRCEPCQARSRAWSRARYQERKKARLCVNCGQPAEGHTRCGPCQARSRAWSRARRRAREAARDAGG